jgi:hypothetical protein
MAEAVPGGIMAGAARGVEMISQVSGISQIYLDIPDIPGIPQVSAPGRGGGRRPNHNV